MVVIDASVVLAAFFPDENSLPARRLIADYAEGIEEFYAPRLLTLELVNASLVALRRHRIDEAIFNQLVEAMTSLHINWVDIESHGWELAQLSKEHKISAYDAAYVQAAKLLNCKLVTGDIKLVMAVGDPVIKLENYYSEEKT
mgnify:FL=1